MERNQPAVDRELEEMRWVRGLAANLVADAGLAEDIAQETLIAAWQRGRMGGAAKKGWLATVARNVLRQHRRSENRRAHREQRGARTEALPSPAELTLRMERQKLLAEALTKLDEPYRSTVILRYSEGLQPSEIARRLKLPAGTIRRRLSVGLDRLRSDLDRHFEGDRAAWVGALLPFFAPKSLELAIAELGWGASWLSIAGMVAMKKLVLVALVLALAGGVWFVARDTGAAVDDGGVEDGARTENLAQRDEPVPQDSPTELTATPETERSAAGSMLPVPEPTTRRLTGRVDSPPGAPEDGAMEVFVLSEPAFYAAFMKPHDARSFDEDAAEIWRESVIAATRVEPDGSFAIELPIEVEEAHLMLRGRFMYLPRTQGVQMSGLAPSAILAPMVGACLRGRVVSAADGSGVGGVELSIDAQGGQLSPADGMLQREMESATRSAADGGFELRALPAKHAYGIVALPREYGAARTFAEDLLPGELRMLSLELQAGAAMSGTVIGPDGTPLADAQVVATFPGRWFGLDTNELRETSSDAQGAFELSGVSTSEAVTIVVRKHGYLVSERKKFTLEMGQHLEGLRIELGIGRTIEGRVVWPDGSPAAQLEVEAVFDSAWLGGESALNALRGASSSTRTDSEGRFVAGGLGAGPFVVSCHGKRDALTHVARRDGIEPGGEPLSLTLHAPIGLEGFVVDETGTPIESFRIQTQRVVEGSIGATVLERQALPFDDPSGAFRLEDLIEGRYEFFVTAGSHVSPAPFELSLPRARGAAPIVLETMRSARVTGRVLAADRTPFAGARVYVDTGVPSYQRELVAGRPPLVAVSDALGRFELNSLIPGEIELVAEAEGWARSAPLALQVEAGEELEDQVLLLEEGASLTGEVYDTEGRPASSWIVNMTQTEGGDALFITTDPLGHFSAEDLSAGKWMVVAINMSKDWDVDEDGVGVDQLVSDMRMAFVDLKPGAEEHVVLGSAPRDPLVVRGSVTFGDEPSGGTMVAFQSSEGGSPAMAGVGDDGEYELTVDGAGTYNVSVQIPSAQGWGFNALEYVRVVADAPDQRIDFALPTGSLTGLVEGSNGDPLPGARVTVTAAPERGNGGERGERFVETRTDEHGVYSIDALDPGLYNVFAGGPTMEGKGSGARVARSGVEVALGEAVSGINFRLPVPGSVDVTVLDLSGRPLAGAAVWARDAAGTLLDPMSFLLTDSQGAATATGLAPGSYTFFARTGTLASAESEPLRVLSDETGALELVLGKGTQLWVRSADEKREPVRMLVTVTDRKGHDVGNAFSASKVQSWYEEGAFSPWARRVGPLPEGRYYVRGVAADGRVAEKSVSLGGRDQRTVKLRFKD